VNKSALTTKAGYFARSASRFATAETCCPGCANARTFLVRRKWLVLSLWECSRCGLRFRIPKDDIASSEFYEKETYTQGFTTAIPDDETLRRLLDTQFAGTEGDFSAHIDRLRGLGLGAGSCILDYGSSWGYASAQFAHSGMNVYSYEIGRDRARFAKEKLGCRMVDNLTDLAGMIDCFFTSHVIEHLQDPSSVFVEARSVLRKGGLLVSYCPNGNPAREQALGTERYDLIWPRVHPMVITPTFMKYASATHGFSCEMHSSPYLPSEKDTYDDLLGPELLYIGCSQ
jgi:hypothetical protein